ncbi:unnamed protein product [Bursaphelenchus okinawaensis]|uniref:Uncharacterized protein n=1 Tax=Bursaphelenchus okinawaensis TaxID=465554 RepID=A0A811L689_9BILA|nr:unnamed protein product [Bursaphelenchus okinawaensis]CAG9116669.1 unnamed protein product [Bursaphelenchus okinawaensis]
MRVHVINENDSCFIQEQCYDNRHLKIEGSKCEIYSMKKQKIFFVAPDEMDYWKTFNYKTPFNTMTSRFLVYDKHNYEWMEVQVDAKFRYACNFELFASIYPLPRFEIMEFCRNSSYAKSLVRHVFIQFKKGGVRVKHFKATHNRTFPPKKTNSDHQIEMLTNMKFPVPKGSSVAFYNWFAQLHIANDNVPVIDAKTGATQHFDFYLLNPNEQ